MSVPNSAVIVGPQWWRHMCAAYLAHLHRKGRRPNTLLAYGYELLAFGRWLEQVAIADVDQLTGGHLERFQDWRASTIKPKTQQVSATAVRGVFKWAATQEPPLSSPALWLHIVMPRVGRPLPRPIPRADLDKLLAAFQHRPEPNDLVALRTRALFLVILSSGARISEALSLDLGQLQDRQAFVVQKGGGEKLLVISEMAEEAVTDYVAARSDTCPALFVSHDPDQPTARLSRKSSAFLALRAIGSATRLQPK
jgi:site-specific recombinase XerD